MSLIKCPECNRLISELETNCPNCDFELTDEIIFQFRAEEVKDLERKFVNKKDYMSFLTL